MGKNDFLTPKAIANRIKAKGLQKLRWYCQMCQKQCRDENGFKCHCMSESHQRQMQVFGQNPHRFVGGYSEEFETAFMEHMKRSHRFSRVAATVVYNEYIADRHHVHMNSTKWVTLTEFVKYLGKTGKCKVEETPKGWFITYNDKEPETLLKEGLKNKRQKAELADADRHERMIADQIERAAKFAKLESPEEDASSSLPSDEENQRTFQTEEKIEKIAFSLGGLKAQASSDAVTHNIKPSVFEDEEEKVGGKSDRLRPMPKDKRDQAGALDEIMKEQERAKEKVNRKDYWLYEGLVVKVMSKALAEKGYYKQKGTVMKVVGKYVGEIEMLESGDMLKVDQEELETVIPQIGGLVKIVNGAYRGSNARLLSVDTSNFCVKVQIEKGMYDGRVLPSVLYEDVCKCIPNA